MPESEKKREIKVGFCRHSKSVIIFISGKIGQESGFWVGWKWRWKGEWGCGVELEKEVGSSDAAIDDGHSAMQCLFNISRRIDIVDRYNGAHSIAVPTLKRQATRTTYGLDGRRRTTLDEVTEVAEMTDETSKVRPKSSRKPWD
ncbi:Hypothetical predicted protein [Olea europaea subsp. europaea]|uniref:Uncharacterized protein n=1 Tax=Olea europaea subsp. europaea TaxID=158383 RepID=A0A8S0TES1_OLEEU|nr:Hypothetical predicted protein [Olea europaea subsp. europaea]